MIKIHGMEKITAKLKQEIPLLSPHQEVLIMWPGHFAVMLHKGTDNRFELTMYGARQSETNALIESLDIQGWNPDMIPSLSWNFG